MEHLHAAILTSPEFTLKDGTKAKTTGLQHPEMNEDGELTFAFDVTMQNGSHLEFTVKNTGWGKSFVAAQGNAPKGRRR